MILWTCELVKIFKMITNSVTFYGFFAKMAFVKETIGFFYKIGIYWKNLISFHYGGQNTTAAYI